MKKILVALLLTLPVVSRATTLIRNQDITPIALGSTAITVSSDTHLGAEQFNSSATFKGGTFGAGMDFIGAFAGPNVTGLGDHNYHIIYRAERSSGSGYPYVYINADNGANYYGGWRYVNGSSSYAGSFNGGSNGIPVADTSNTIAGEIWGSCDIGRRADSANNHVVECVWDAQNASGNQFDGQGTSGGVHAGSGALSSIGLDVSAGGLTSRTIWVYQWHD